MNPLMKHHARVDFLTLPPLGIIAIPDVSIWHLKRSLSGSNPIFSPSSITFNLSTITFFRLQPFLNITLSIIMEFSTETPFSIITPLRITELLILALCITVPSPIILFLMSPLSILAAGPSEPEW